MEAELSRSSFYDRVTGLPNRALLADRIGHSLSWTRPNDDDPVAILLLDLDRNLPSGKLRRKRHPDFKNAMVMLRGYLVRLDAFGQRVRRS